MSFNLCYIDATLIHDSAKSIKNTLNIHRKGRGIHYKISRAKISKKGKTGAAKTRDTTAKSVAWLIETPGKIERPSDSERVTGASLNIIKKLENGGRPWRAWAKMSADPEVITEAEREKVKCDKEIES